MKIVIKLASPKPADGLTCGLQALHPRDLIMQETSFTRTICGIDFNDLLFVDFLYPNSIIPSNSILNSNQDSEWIKN
jgi:hypothetical protein